MKPGRKPTDFTGRRIKTRVVIGPADATLGCRGRWRVRCLLCRRESVVLGRALANEQGCIRCEVMEDLTGQKHGRLTFVRPAKRPRWWVAFCECGAVVQMPGVQAIRQARMNGSQLIGCGGCPVTCARCGVTKPKSVGRRGTDATLCSACVKKKNARERQTSVRGRTCHSCGRADSRTRWSQRRDECNACNRMACRNGRDEAGRPIARGRRVVTQPGAP